MDRPGTYYAMSVGFLTESASIEALGEAHGPAGPLVIVALLGEAKKAAAGGEVRLTLKRLARDAFFNDSEQAGAIVADAIRLGTLEEIEVSDRTCHVRFPKFGDWQPRAADADRKARARAAKRDDAEETA